MESLRALTAAELSSVRELAYRKARALRVGEGKARLIADAIVAELAVRCDRGQAGR